MDQNPGRRRRRTHSAAFKGEAVAACNGPDASIAACPLERSINANLLRKWVIDAERAQAGSLVPTSAAPVASDTTFSPYPCRRVRRHHLMLLIILDCHGRLVASISEWRPPEAQCVGSAPLSP
jgi:transposase-like protein